jgi:hypothetical protein
MEGIKKDGQTYETAKTRSEERGKTGFYGAENLSTQTNAGKNIQVTYDLDTISGYGGLSWHLRVEGNSKVIRPVGWVRQVKAAAETVERIGD